VTSIPLALAQRRPSVGGAGSARGSNMRHAEAYAANTTAAVLKSGAWPRLLSRCGDDLMLHLLLHASLFASLPNACLLQLSGLPAAEVRADAHSHTVCRPAKVQLDDVNGAWTACSTWIPFLGHRSICKPGLTAEHVHRWHASGERRRLQLVGCIRAPTHSNDQRTGRSW